MTIDEFDPSEKDWEEAIAESDLRKVFDLAALKFRKGQAEHGAYRPESETRNCIEEMRKELLDAIVYLAMGYMKLEARLERIERFERRDGEE